MALTNFERPFTLSHRSDRANISATRVSEDLQLSIFSTPKIFFQQNFRMGHQLAISLGHQLAIALGHQLAISLGHQLAISLGHQLARRDVRP